MMQLKVRKRLIVAYWKFIIP